MIEKGRGEREVRKIDRRVRKRGNVVREGQRGKVYINILHDTQVYCSNVFLCTEAGKQCLALFSKSDNHAYWEHHS